MSTVGMIILILYRTISPYYLEVPTHIQLKKGFDTLCIIMNAKICRQVLLL